MVAELKQTDPEGTANLELFRDCLSAVLVKRLSPSPSKKPRRKSRPRRCGPHPKSNATGCHARSPEESVGAGSGAPLFGRILKPSAAAILPVTDGDTRDGDGADAATAAEELGEFIDYIAASSFAALPEDLRSLSHRGWAEDQALSSRYPLPLTGGSLPNVLPCALDPHVVDSLQAYGVLPSSSLSSSLSPSSTSAAEDLLAPVLNDYIEAATAPPPPRVARGAAEACEMCGRGWINLSYHHLIPRMVHDKAVRRGWHREDELQNVAWLCGACHRAVHRFARHEDLARHYYTVERLLAQDELAAFARWVGRLRWKKK
ncbi:hypothetical protein GGTG_13775 [Gaeumannomyces tritici R3-111a-1]|uniref:HNH domain-containing protein n=1 Tax=Gaeumannomyces tritici (strain R3-111a-1) TaxID=644352 RepID=J3PJT6_GAET3|nr:hypothetical protein GGTG_13775 [Gaeumannomyces tritici R3-111a-1]EJT68659.1 hypothetical protein GGTG_13775 [Gaeumannomyces tritici R3-111a-1]